MSSLRDSPIKINAVSLHFLTKGKPFIEKPAGCSVGIKTGHFFQTCGKQEAHRRFFLFIGGGKMKKYILLLPSAIVPYSLLFALYCIFSGFLMESLFRSSIFVVLLYISVLFVIALLCNIIFFALSISRKWPSEQIALANMMIKLIQIPAYVLIFILGVIFSISIFTYAFSFFFVIFDFLTIFLTGLIGVSAVVRCYRDGKVSEEFSVVNGILQFVFCVDVISAGTVFIKSKSKPIK